MTLPEGADPFVALFSETAGRVLVSLGADAVDDLVALCAALDCQPGDLFTVTTAED